jgi:hypothetical protein
MSEWVGLFTWKVAHQGLISSENFIHVLVDRQQKRIPLGELVPMGRYLYQALRFKIWPPLPYTRKLIFNLLDLIL